ncbi:hypothetical protein CEQ21_00910 [Niallia circulans]|uniref:Uncharacterized protein n=1 Tax=Niallia circulans TaxID=1397 RepID=A0A553SRE0_NIACI|nr:hypothetical protein CEQ21_00910 [Niallia circulans]
MMLPDLYSKLAIAPLCIFVLIMAILYLLLKFKDKGFFAFMLKIYAVFIIVNYVIALYFRFIGLNKLF